MNDKIIIETNYPEDDIVFHDVRQEPFDVYGFYDYKNQPIFRRLPEDVAALTSEKVNKLSRNSTGGRVRFCTDSDYIILHAEYESVNKFSQIPLSASAGFDLYESYQYDSRFICPFSPPSNTEKQYTRIKRFTKKKLRYFTINFPILSDVKNLYIGVQESASLGHGKSYRNEKPVIFYGSSIVHGIAAGRPGLTYPNIISNRQNINFTNLGFSGAALAETAISEYMANLPMSIFVCDYDHNSPDAEYLNATHQRLYDTIRAKNPTVPYIMITRPNAATNPSGAAERKDVVINTFRYATEKGDKNVYFIDGDTFFTGPYENECTVDGVHPNDLGFALMADGIENHIIKAIRQNPDFSNKIE